MFVTQSANFWSVSIGLTLLDSDVSHPFWNHLVRILRQITSVYERVTGHCATLPCQSGSNSSSGGACVLCELALIFRTLLPLHLSRTDDTII
jgi:hypothetical protein